MLLPRGTVNKRDRWGRRIALEWMSSLLSMKPNKQEENKHTTWPPQTVIHQYLPGKPERKSGGEQIIFFYCNLLRVRCYIRILFHINLDLSGISWNCWSSSCDPQLVELQNNHSGYLCGVRRNGLKSSRKSFALFGWMPWSTILFILLHYLAKMSFFFSF